MRFEGEAFEPLPSDSASATLVGRVWDPGVGGPSRRVDPRRRGWSTSRLPRRPCATSARRTIRPRLRAPPTAETLGALDRNSGEHAARKAATASSRGCIAPIDLQAIKAAGVTFVVSMLERVIEEQARGAAERANEIRAEIIATIGDDLRRLKPGSEQATALKELLIRKGMWSQYLEVGIGPDAEVFTKAQPMSAVGHLAEAGLNPMSAWNNPEPEVVLVVSSAGRIVGATLGNDVNLRDVEGRSALLLGKAKDNNASAAIGPFIRLFDADFSSTTCAGRSFA